jgi:hypothetical protein
VLKGALNVIDAKKLGVAVVLVAAMSAWLVWRPEPHSAPPVVAASPIEAQQIAPAATQVPSPAPTVTAAKQSDAAISLSAKVKFLSASPEPRDAFTAFHILSQCKSAKDEERQYQQTRQAERDPERALLVRAGVVGPEAVDKACGDLQDGDFRARIALVERAAEAGVPMAALRLANEGPWGDEQALYTRWDDPLVQEWRAKVIRLTQLAATKGDVTALNALQAQYEDGAGLIAEKNSELALQYAVAKHIVYEAQTGRKIVGAKQELEHMTAAVSSEVATRARSAGEKLAKEALGGKVN